MFQDLAGFRDFSDQAEHLEQKLGRMVREEYDKWEGEVLECMRNGSDVMSGRKMTVSKPLLSEKMSGKLIEINEQTGILAVNYSERLVTLLREVRQLGEMGFQVDQKIRKVAEEGEKYYRYGVMLKKVANYYNTMEHQIIPQQRRMLLDALMHFEDVVNNSRVQRSGENNSEVTWTNPAECEDYVSRLQQAAERLSSENRKLRKAHARLGEDVVALMSVDLLRPVDLI